MDNLSYHIRLSRGVSQIPSLFRLAGEFGKDDRAIRLLGEILARQCPSGE